MSPAVSPSACCALDFQGSHIPESSAAEQVRQPDTLLEGLQEQGHPEAIPVSGPGPPRGTGPARRRCFTKIQRMGQ